MALAARQPLTWTEYLALSADSDVKLEYRQGWIVAMTGGSRRHSALAVRMTYRLVAALGESGPCRVYNSDLRVRVPATGLATYPDVSVVCGPDETDPDSSETLTNPCVVIEVLSDSTESYDRGTKFFNYQQLESLEDYVLVNQNHRVVDHFRRTDGGAWEARRLQPGDTLVLHAGAEIAIDDLYAGILSADEEQPEPERGLR